MLEAEDRRRITDVTPRVRCAGNFEIGGNATALL